MPYNERFLKPENVLEPERKPIVTLAIKTAPDMGEFICGAFIGEHEQEPTWFDTLDQLHQAMLSPKYRGHRWYAHNGGEADYKYLIPMLLDFIFDNKAVVTPIVRSGMRTIGFIVKIPHYPSIQLRDSHAVLPVTLGDLAAKFAPRFTITELAAGEHFDPDDPEHILMLRTEVLALRRSLQAFDSLLLEHFNVHMQWSAASTALRAWRKTMPQDAVHIRQNAATEEISREAYYGGLTYVRDTRMHTDFVSLDVNAMYAAAMRYGVPTGSSTKTNREMPGYPGIYKVRVTCPVDVPIAMLPQRREIDGIMTLRWPRGTFATTITSMEIALARKLGYEVEVISGVFWDKTACIFDTFVDLCETLEVPNRGTALGDTAKAMRVGLPGKFGTRPDQTDYLMAEDMPEGYDLVITSNGRGRTLQDAYVDCFYQKPITDSKPHMQPHWAAWITARARCMLVKLIGKIGYEYVRYCDTDCVFLSIDIAAAREQAGAIVIGPAYGRLKVADVWQWIQIAAPKQYAGLNRDGIHVNVAKGLQIDQLTPDMPSRALAGEDVRVQFRTLTSTLQLLRGATERTAHTDRKYTTIRDNPNWVSDGDDSYLPVLLNE